MKTTITRLLALCLSLTLALCLFACSDGTTAPNSSPDTDITDNAMGGTTWALTFTGDDWSAPAEAGVTQNGNVTLLTKAGAYHVSGTLNDGQLRVRIAKTEKITLTFDNFTASCSTSAPVYIESADKVNIVLLSGSVNTLTDAKNYVFNGTDTKPNACLYSSEDITIKGEGKLIVNANYNNGIGSKNDLEITGGTYEITAVKNALKGNDSVTITDGDIVIKRCSDGIKTDATEVGRGVLTVSGGNIEIHAEDDGLQASQKIDVTGGKITVEALGKITNCDGETNIASGCLVEQ